MVFDGVLPEKEISGWRAADGEEFPTPNTHEIVVFVSFFYRGFGVPTSDFFCGLLTFYGIELVHLNPNSILHIATFIHFCEAFLGIRPHFALFRSLFLLKPCPSASQITVAGGAGFQLRPGKSSLYLGLKLATSLKGWHKRWFYIANPAPSLPSYRGLRPLVRDCWNSSPSPREMGQVNDLLEMIEVKKRQGVSGLGVVTNFIYRRVNPIKERVHPAYEFTGLGDPTRESDARWELDALSDRLRSLFASDVVLDMTGHPKPYSLDHPADEVIFFALLFAFIFF